jgi:iron-sulfur cluster assembly protein
MITITEKAANKIKSHINNRGKGIGILIGIQTTGCSGLAYKLEYVDELPNNSDYMSYMSQDVLILVSQKDLPYITGLKMEWKRDGLNEGFDFINPNEKARCGCGESFTI